MPGQTKVRVLIADDHPLVREALSQRIGAEPDMTVLGTVVDASEAVAAALRESPDAVIMDVDMPGMTSFDATELIRQHNPATRVLFLSAFSQDCYIDQAIRAGASGYVSKAEPVDAVVRAIREVAGGRAYYSPSVRHRLASGCCAQPPGEARSRASTLTHREVQVLRYVAAGMSAKKIALALNISVRTVDRHRSNIMAKLGIHDRVELTLFAHREGIAMPVAATLPAQPTAADPACPPEIPQT